MVQCIRAIECVSDCDGPVLSSGCCPCPAGTFDKIECMTGAGGTSGSAGANAGGSSNTGGSAPSGDAGAGGDSGSGGAVDLGDAIADPDTTGTGACAQSTLAEVIERVHESNPNLANIDYVYDPQNPSIGLSNYLFAFATAEGFRLIFHRGAGDCPAGCINHELWYFETDASCEPVQVGRLAYGSSRGCVEVIGAPLWNFPTAVPNRTCADVNVDDLNDVCENDECPNGFDPVFFYGIAGTAGPRFCWCGIHCNPDVDLCPTGTSCQSLADGPQDICYAP
jgi:hypothetical protein